MRPRPSRRRSPFLQGTEIDGELDLDAKGHFAPNPQARALFDYFLSATGEESDDVIRARIVTHVRTTLPHDAAAEAEQILDLYLRYRAHMREQSATTSPPADLERRLQWIREERRKIFGAEVADALFGEEEEVVRLDLERRRIALDTTLSPAEKTARLEALEARLPERVHAARHDAAAPARLDQQVDALRASGAGDAAVFAAREREFGTEAAQRLAALDAESDAWQARVDAYRAERASAYRCLALPIGARSPHRGASRSALRRAGAHPDPGARRGDARMISLVEIRAAADTLRGRIVETPCAYSASLSELTGARVVLKLENLQRTASFKERGALVKLLSLSPEARRRGVVTLSAGNHAQGVAYHARILGIPAVVVMPRFTPDVKVERTRSYGAEVILEGESLEEAARFTERLVSERGLALVHPYDDAHVIAGQGTVALEMLDQVPDLDVLLVPTGGGGLLAGCAVAAKALRPGILVFGVEAARFPSLHCALEGREIRCETSTLADGIAVTAPGRIALEIARCCVDGVLLVEEEEIENAVLLLLEVEKTVAEGAGAVGLAALLQARDRFAGMRVGIVVSGGNIDLLLLSSILQRGLVRSGRLLRIRVTLTDRPGALAGVAECLGALGANIVQVEHQRTFTELPLRAVEAGFVLQTRGPAHAREILESLARAGYPTQRVDGAG